MYVYCFPHKRTVYFSGSADPNSGYKREGFPASSCGIFTNPSKRTSFEFKEEEETFIADILQIDARFVSLLKWLGENHINVRLSGAQTSDGYAVYKIREIAFGGGAKSFG